MDLVKAESGTLLNQGGYPMPLTAATEERMLVQPIDVRLRTAWSAYRSWTDRQAGGSVLSF